MQTIIQNIWFHLCEELSLFQIDHKCPSFSPRSHKDNLCKGHELCSSDTDPKACIPELHVINILCVYVCVGSFSKRPLCWDSSLCNMCFLMSNYLTLNIHIGSQIILPLSGKARYLITTTESRRNMSCFIFVCKDSNWWLYYLYYKKK